MATTVGGVRVLMSGIAHSNGSEEIVVDDGNGTTLTIDWNRPDKNSSSGGTFNNLVLSLPVEKPLFASVNGFGIGDENSGRQVDVRVYVDWVFADQKVVSYTVLVRP